MIATSGVPGSWGGAGYALVLVPLPMCGGVAIGYRLVVEDIGGGG